MPLTLFQALIADGALTLDPNDFVIEPLAAPLSLAFSLALNSGYVALLEDDL